MSLERRKIQIHEQIHKRLHDFGLAVLTDYEDEQENAAMALIGGTMGMMIDLISILAQEQKNDTKKMAAAKAATEALQRHYPGLPLPKFATELGELN